jgi:mRNA-degrading endonuclease YafQ of YafQ-DinJ toxin-antitoxin module
MSLKNLIEESFRRAISDSIVRYRQDTEKSEKDFDDEEHNFRRRLDARARDLEEIEHLPALTSLERKFRRELSKIEERDEQTAEKIKEVLRPLMGQGRFDDAEKMKRDLNNRREDERERDIQDIRVQYRSQRSEKLRYQREELNILERSFQDIMRQLGIRRKIETRRLKKDFLQEINETQAKLVMIAAKVQADGPAVRKESSGRFAEILKDLLDEEGIVLLDKNSSRYWHHFFTPKAAPLAKFAKAFG